MKLYKTINIAGANPTNRYIDEDKINEMAKDGWVLVNVQAPPNAINNRWITGIFVKDAMLQPVKEPVVDQPKRGPGRPPKVAEPEPVKVE
jgi:hypothetical protein